MASHRSNRSGNLILLESLEPRLLLDAIVDDPLDDLLATSSPTPPAGYVYDAPLTDAGGAGTTVLLDEVPEYFWYRGCGPTSVGMILGYWDILGYPNYFVGDASTQTDDVNAGIASEGHDDDWVPDPDAPPPHHADDSIADFFETSREPLPYGWSYLSKADDAFIGYSDYVGYSAAHAWNKDWSDLSWADFTSEINAGRPMMFLVDSDGNGETDHFVPIIGYRTDPGQQYAAYTTWQNDSGIHWFDWQGMSAGDSWGIRAATLFRPSHTQPDLVTSYTNIWPSSLSWGDDFNYIYSIDNFGSIAAGGFDVKFYLSPNSTISSADYELHSMYVSSLDGGGHLGGGVPLSLPASPPSGFTASDDVYIGMVVDGGFDVAESVETNNSNRGDGIDRKAVHIATGPDLLGSALELDVPMLNLGPVEAAYTIENVGETAAGGFTVRFYLSENSYISTADTLLGEQVVSGLGGGGSYSNTITLTPGSTDPFDGNGAYTIGMIIDANNDVAESVEGNNRNEGYGLDMARANYGTRIFHADFEHGDGAMDIINDTAWAPNDGLWHLTTNRGGDIGHSGTHSLHYGRLDKPNAEWDYDIGDSAGVVYSKRIELPDEPVALSFNYFCHVDSFSTGDDIRAQVYDPDTGTYTTVLSKSDGLSYNTLRGWRQATADLTAFAGRNVRLRFVFDTRDATYNNYEGWYVDDIAVWAVNNPITIEGFRSLSPYSDYHHEASYINWAADHDTFIFNEEQTDGTFTITTDAEGSAVNGALAVYDRATGEMLHMDSGSGAGTEASITLANSGHWNSYIVEVWDEEEDATGELDVHIEGSYASYTATLTPDDNGDASVTGLINTDEDTDYYRVTAPPQASGDLDITLSEIATDLQTRLQVWRGLDDAKPEVIAYTAAGPETAHFSNVEPGEIFYIAVADHDFNGTGNFELTVDFSMAVPGTLTNAEGYLYFDGPHGLSPDTQSFGAYISTNDTDSYRFAGDSGWTGDYTITVNRLSGTVDPVVAVYDPSTGEQLAFNRDHGDETTARVTVALDGWTPYIIAAADATRTNSGDVEILVQAPGTSSGMTVPLDANGDGQRTGQSITANDTDFYRLTAPADTDGTLEITVTPSTGFDPAIALFDGSGNEVAHAFSQAVGVAETLSLTGLTPGEAYSLAVLAENHATTGTFDLAVDWGQVVPGTYPGGHDFWTMPDVHGDRQQGFALSEAGDWDGWMFASDVADPDAVFTVTGDGLAPVLGLYEVATNTRLAYDVNTDGDTAATFTAPIAAHTRYYLVASDRNGATGTISLSMDIDAMSYTTVPVNADGTGLGSGTLTNPADANYFLFTAPPTAAYGDLTVTIKRPDASLESSLVLWNDTTGQRLGSAGAHTPGAPISFSITNAQAGHVYAAGVTSMVFNSGSGSFDVAIDFSVRKPGDADLDGDVDLDDFAILKTNFGNTGAGWGQGDFDGNGTVDLDDFSILKRHFGSAAAAAVDEPVDLLAADEPLEAADTVPVRRRLRRRRRTADDGATVVLEGWAISPLG